MKLSDFNFSAGSCISAMVVTLLLFTSSRSCCICVCLTEYDFQKGLHWITTVHKFLSFLHLAASVIKQFNLVPAKANTVNCLPPCFCRHQIKLLGDWSNKVQEAKKTDYDWIGLSNILCPRQYSIGYMGNGFYRSNQQYKSTEGTNSTQTNQTYNKQTW